MSDPSMKMTCPDHGASFATFVCVHLARGVACGYHPAGETADDPWPDAWCDRCEEHVKTHGGWDESAETAENFTVACTGCYEVARRRNANLPSGLPRGVVRLTSAQANAFIDHAVAESQALQAKAIEEFDLGRTDGRWAVSDETGLFTMSDGDGRVRVAASFQYVGTFSTVARSWMWGWANELPYERVSDVDRLATLGEVRGIDLLARDVHEDVDEEHGIALACVARHVLGYQAVYHGQMEDLRTYLILDDLRWTA